MRVLVADDISPKGLIALHGVPGVSIRMQTGMRAGELATAIADVDALLVRSQTKVTEPVLAEARRLKVIGRAGVGVDNIDVAAATKRGIIVVNAPDGNTISAAEHTFAMMLSMARRIPQAYASVSAFEWDRKSYVGVELSGKTLTIIGMGRIGTEVAKRAKAFAMRVIAYDPFLTEERAKSTGIVKATLETAVEQADFITIHTPLVKETYNLIGAAMFARMKDGVRLINCARGGIVDEVALADALSSGKVAGAALDVYAKEPFAVEHPLRQFSNVIFTPHIAASTEEAQFQVAVSVAEEVANVLQGLPFQNAVNLPSLPKEQKAYLDPYLTLGEKLGAFLGQLLAGDLGTIEIQYTGELAGQDVSLVSRAILKGLLAQRYSDEVNYVNAPVLVDAAGLTVKESKQVRNQGYTNLIHVAVRLPDGRQRRVSGMIYEGVGPRLVAVDDYRIDASPQGRMIYTEHQDRPGMIGHLGKLLGDNEINIASMQVGRQESGGQAIMLLSIDRPVPDHLVQSIRALAGVSTVRTIEL